MAGGLAHSFRLLIFTPYSRLLFLDLQKSVLSLSGYLWRIPLWRVQPVDVNGTND
jgi:hypothetical protein